MSLYSEPEDCGYCCKVDDGSPAISLHCGHKFHHGCLVEWFRLTAESSELACPQCRNDGRPKYQCCHCHLPIQDLKDGFEMDCECAYHIACLKQLMELQVLVCQRCKWGFCRLDIRDLEQFTVHTTIDRVKTE